MTKRIERGTFVRSHDCGWSGTYTAEGVADYALSRHSCERTRTKAQRSARLAERMAQIDRTPKSCNHPVADHQHGTYACYVLDKCRCLPCAEARTAWDSNRARQKAYGRWDQWIDAQPTREHVRALMASGMGGKRIIALGATNSGQIWKLLYGRLKPDGTRTPTKRIRRDVAERLLALEPDLANGAAVRSLGATRRLRALVALGWSQAELGRRLNVYPATMQRILGGKHATMTRNVVAIAALYDELSMTRPPEVDHITRSVASKSRQYAVRRRWLPPLAIDDEVLDDNFEGGQIVIELTEVDIDDVAIDRRLGGDTTVRLSQPEKVELRKRWLASGRSLADLERIHGLNASRYQEAS